MRRKPTSATSDMITSSWKAHVEPLEAPDPNAAGSGPGERSGGTCPRLAKLLCPMPWYPGFPKAMRAGLIAISAGPMKPFTTVTAPTSSVVAPQPRVSARPFRRCSACRSTRRICPGRGAQAPCRLLPCVRCLPVEAGAKVDHGQLRLRQAVEAPASGASADLMPAVVARLALLAAGAKPPPKALPGPLAAEPPGRPEATKAAVPGACATGSVGGTARARAGGAGWPPPPRLEGPPEGEGCRPAFEPEVGCDPVTDCTSRVTGGCSASSSLIRSQTARIRRHRPETDGVCVEGTFTPGSLTLGVLTLGTVTVGAGAVLLGVVVLGSGTDGVDTLGVVTEGVVAPGSVVLGTVTPPGRRQMAQKVRPPWRLPMSTPTARPRANTAIHLLVPEASALRAYPISSIQNTKDSTSKAPRIGGFFEPPVMPCQPSTSPPAARLKEPTEPDRQHDGEQGDCPAHRRRGRPARKITGEEQV